MNNLTLRALILIFAVLTTNGNAALSNKADVTSSTGHSIELTFDAPATRTLSYRQAGMSQPRRTLTDVQEKVFNLIDLEPRSRYSIDIGSDIEGATTATIEAETVAEAGGSGTGGFGRLSWGAFRPLETFPDNVWYPTVEYHDGRLWLVESYKGQIHLSEMDAATSAIFSKRTIVEQPFPGRETYVGIMDSAIHDGKLWIMYNEQDTNHPDGYHIKMSRQKILSYDMATTKLSSAVTVEPLNADSGTWEGGIEVLNGKLWTACLDVWLEDNKRRTKIVMREFDGEKFGQPVIYDDCPTSYPYGPSISMYNGKLLVLFSDLIPYETDKNREPLYYTMFDGKAFSPAKKIFDDGRNRYAKGVQLGESFVLAWKSGADWWREFRYKYHDIAVGVLNPESGTLATYMAVDDRKYNSSPDLTKISDRHAVMVFGKFDHEYTKADPSYNHGGYEGDIILEESRP